MGLSGLQSRYQQNYIPLEPLRKNPRVVQLLEIVYISWLVALPPVFKVSSIDSSDPSPDSGPCFSCQFSSISSASFFNLLRIL